MATTIKFSNSDNQILELWINDKNDVYIQVYSFDDPYCAQWITLDKSDATKLKNELSKLIKLL
jgi:hypothetical protein